MGFARWMASAAGRWLRVVAGGILILAAFYVGGIGGGVLGLVGVVAVLAGALNFCLLGPVFGAPLSGKRTIAGS